MGKTFLISLTFILLNLNLTLLKASENKASTSGKSEQSKPLTSSEKPLTANTEADSQNSEKTQATPAENYADMLAKLQLEDNEKLDIFVYTCKNIRGTTLKRILDNFITSAGNVSNSDEADIVVVSDVESNLKIIKNIAKKVDLPVPQILVEARIVELTLDSDFEKEVTFAYESLPDAHRSFIQKIATSIISPSPNALVNQGVTMDLRPFLKLGNKSEGEKKSLDLFIRFLESRGKAKILSSPNLVLRRGSEGNIITGEEIPILTQTVVSGSISTSTEFKSVGIKLKVTPIMITGDTVRLKVAPEVSTVTGFTSASTTGVSNPRIAVRNASTELEIKDGELISIGGLYKTEERSIKRRVPVLSSLPILGHLFRGNWVQTVRTQLVIFLNITILAEGKKGMVRITKPDKMPKPVQQEIKRMEKKMHHPAADIHRDLRNLKKYDLE